MTEHQQYKPGYFVINEDINDEEKLMIAIETELMMLDIMKL